MDSQTVVARAAVIRKRRGESRAEVAERLGVPVETYRSVETGRTNVSVEWLVRIARALDVSVVDLLGDPATDTEVREVIATVTRHHCERCQGRMGEVEALTRADLESLAGMVGLSRGRVEQALLLARHLDECPDPGKVVTLSRELRMVVDGIKAAATPQAKGGGAAPARGAGGGEDDQFADLGVPV